MSQDSREILPRGSAILWYAALALLCWPLGALAGMMLGLITDFGLLNTTENIRLNPHIFIDQYASDIVWAGHLALLSLAALVVIVTLQLILIRAEKTASDNPDSANRPLAKRLRLAAKWMGIAVFIILLSANAVHLFWPALSAT